MINGFDQLRIELKALQVPLQRRLCNGPITTLEEYRSCSGYLKGIQDSEALLDKIYKKLFETQKEDNHDNQHKNTQLY